jgi:UDP-perosamine 4-acetyltransferase
MFIGLGSTKDTQPRRRLYELALANGFRSIRTIHPQAIISSSAIIGAGPTIMANAVINAATTLGENVIVNTGAIIEHDCTIGDHVHIATGAKLASTVRVGKGAHIGLGASVRQGISIGECSLVGAGSVVVDDVAPWTVVVGVPARPISHAGLGALKLDPSRSPSRNLT